MERTRLLAETKQQEYFSESKLDQLWHGVKGYRSSKHFKEMMEACARLRHLAPYNAMLVDMQRPEAKYVLAEDEWKNRYGRDIIPNARPLIVLFPFGPVAFVFDISDTYDTGLMQPGKTEKEILDEIAAPYKTKHDVTDEMLLKLTSKLSIHGIAIDNHFIAGTSYAAKLEIVQGYVRDINIRINKDITVCRQPDFLLSVNEKAHKGERFASICHELGHLFCYHLSSPFGWKRWQCRNIPHDAKEFEAEAVSWLISERLGIGNPSEKYLSNYISENEEIPTAVSIERILSATKEVWSLCSDDIYTNYKDGLLYKNNGEFKEEVKQLLK